MGILSSYRERGWHSEYNVRSDGRNIRRDITQLAKRGVHIESHGWNHRDIASMKPEEVVDDLRRAQNCFQSCLGFSPAHCAVAYGWALLSGRAAQDVTGMILLADPRLAIGFIGNRQWNRRDITSDLQGSFA